MGSVSQRTTDGEDTPAERITRRLEAFDRHTLSTIKVELARVGADGTDARVTAKRVGELVLRGRALDKRLLAVEVAAVVPIHLRPMLGVASDGLPPRPPSRPRQGEAGRRSGEAPAADHGRRVIEAMVRHPKGVRDAWLARCGNAARGCRGELGRFERAGGDDAYAHLPPDLRPAGPWALWSAFGYGGDAERGFRVLGAPTRGSRVEKVGRSPLPDRFGNVGGRFDFVGRWRGFVGQIPEPPCSVECPVCRTLNRVATPPVE